MRTVSNFRLGFSPTEWIFGGVCVTGHITRSEKGGKERHLVFVSVSLWAPLWLTASFSETDGSLLNTPVTNRIISSLLLPRHSIGFPLLFFFPSGRAKGFFSLPLSLLLCVFLESTLTPAAELHSLTIKEDNEDEDIFLYSNLKGVRVHTTRRDATTESKNEINLSRPLAGTRRHHRPRKKKDFLPFPKKEMEGKTRSWPPKGPPTKRTGPPIWPRQKVGKYI